MQKPVHPAIVAATLLLAAVPATAQVTTSRSALDALGSGSHPQSAHHAKPHPAAHAQSAHAQSAHAQPAARNAARKPGATAKPSAAGRTNRHQAASTPANAPAATIPGAPPPPPVFTAPVINVPLHPPAPPPPVPVVQTATGTATPLADGVRIGFGASSSDLNPGTMQALHDFAARVKAQPDARAVLDAAAVGSADDPSTPRRLALSRGLAARAVLINDGIASTRIYVRMDPNAAAGSDQVSLHLQSNPDGAAPPSADPAAGAVPATPPAASPAPAAAATPSTMPTTGPGPTPP